MLRKGENVPAPTVDSSEVTSLELIVRSVSLTSVVGRGWLVGCWSLLVVVTSVDWLLLILFSERI
jgi:hypothetical protein